MPILGVNADTIGDGPIKMIDGRAIFPLNTIINGPMRIRSRSGVKLAFWRYAPWRSSRNEKPSLSLGRSLSLNPNPNLCRLPGTAVIGLARGGRFGLRDRRAAELGFLLPRQERIDKDPCQTADGGSCQKGKCECLHVHSLRPPPRLRRHRARRQAVSLRRNIGRAPKTVAFQCRLSGAGR